MPTIILSGASIPMHEELNEIALEWNAQVSIIPKGFLFLPENIKRIHGIHFVQDAGKWECWREADATTWEDFLLMHITHRIADKYALMLEYEFSRSTRLVESRPDLFATFDSYANQVVAKEDGLVRDIKKNWIYTHQNRNVH
jgi:hypothetical protein